MIRTLSCSAFGQGLPNEGSVVLTYPATLSPQSYQDLSDYLELFLRKAKCRAEKGDDVFE
jgi:hypothetical protein